MTATPPARKALATWPTPLEPAPRLATAIGLQADGLWLKRDDLTGLGAGGNKIRKLEWTVGAALAEGADTLVTTGAPQSNHARLTAAAAARCGLSAVLVFPGCAPEAATGNLVLDGLLGAHIVWAGDSGPGQDEQDFVDSAAASAAEDLRADGHHPAIIPFGGSSPVGAHGYRLAASEIDQQKPDVDHIVTAVGSGGTMAGLVAGTGAGRVLGVHAGAVTDPRARVAALLAGMGEKTTATDLRLDTDQVGDGYQTLTPATAHALTVAARTEGLILDPIYSGRALAGLIAAIREHRVAPTNRVVLLTSGGLPGLFGNPQTVEFATRPDA